MKSFKTSYAVFDTRSSINLIDLVVKMSYFYDIYNTFSKLMGYKIQINYGRPYMETNHFSLVCPPLEAHLRR